MSSLADIQRAIRHAVLGGTPEPALLAKIRSEGIPAAARLAVYRNHFRISLSDALGATFATVRQVVGDEFFGAVGRRYIDREPPTQPVLAEYGASFADFLASQPDCAALPYLPDVARLDWAMTRAQQAPDRPSLLAADLAALPSERLLRLRLCPHVTAGLIQSAFPVHRIWRMNQPGWDRGDVSLNEGSVALLVARLDLTASWQVLSAGETAFMAAVADSATLADAFAALLQTDPAADPGLVFSRLVAAGAFASIDEEEER